MSSHNTKPFDKSYKGIKKPRTCLECNIKFISYQAIPSKYCGWNCLNKAKGTAQQKRCRNCHKEFNFAPSQLNAYKGAGKYCSRKCSYERQVKITATKPPPDKYGRTRRKADLEWQRAVRERDDSTCRRCGIYDKHIDTHHINTRAQRPDLKHEVTNGICLCRKCHAWVHFNPIEAGDKGWLGGVSYEIARLDKRKLAMKRPRLGENKACLTCGTLSYFPPSRADRKYCSAQCYFVAKRLHSQG